MSYTYMCPAQILVILASIKNAILNGISMIFWRRFRKYILFMVRVNQLSRLYSLPETWKTMSVRLVDV